MQRPHEGFPSDRLKGALYVSELVRHTSSERGRTSHKVAKGKFSFSWGAHRRKECLSAFFRCLKRGSRRDRDIAWRFPVFPGDTYGGRSERSVFLDAENFSTCCWVFRDQPVPRGALREQKRGSIKIVGNSCLPLRSAHHSVSPARA